MEWQARESESLQEAENIAAQLNELREKQILLQNFVHIEENQNAYETMLQQNEEMVE